MNILYKLPPWLKTGALFAGMAGFIVGSARIFEIALGLAVAAVTIKDWEHTPWKSPPG